MNSMRNLFITGVSLFLGLSVPQYFFEYTTSAQHGPAHTRAGWVRVTISNKHITKEKILHTRFTV